MGKRKESKPRMQSKKMPFNNLKITFNNIKKTFSKMRSDFQEWRTLPKTINTRKKQAQVEIPTIQNTLTLYRSYVTTRNYIATNTDRNIRNSFYWLINEMNELASYEADYYLRFSSLKTLRSLNERWDVVIIRQKELLNIIEQAPSALDFYNKMTSIKYKQHRKKKESLEVGQRLSKAYQALKNAMDYIEKYDQENSISAFGASVLSLEKARGFWGEKLEEVHKMENASDDPNRIINEIESLVKIIYDAPALAKWINEIEKRFNRFYYDHELLMNSYGKVLVQKEVLDEYTAIITSVIPKLWLNGQKDQLNQGLKEFESFLTIYEPELEKEIAFAERHSLRRDNPTSEQGQQLNHLMELTKIFITAMDIRDPLMNTHSMTVARLAVATGKVMNWEQEEIQYLEMAAMLHDVGKIWIPEAILTKKGKLTSEDIGKLRMHPIYGAQILQSSGLFEKIIPWVYHHQELWNGKGYPDGLNGEEIPIQSRIISVCESFDAMLSGSSAKLKLTIEQALDRVKYEAGTLFDPVIVEAFVKAVETQKKDYLMKYVEK
jgi:HD-GYP domain-containing protein (c-di-GMP phosphodiesterase class II)